MASIRRGFSDDFSLDKKSVGIGTTSGQEALDVQGSIKGKDLKVTGISSQTGYEGFLRADHQIAEDTTLSFDQGPVSSLSGEIIVETGKTVTVNEVVKETAGVGNGSGGQWNDLNGNYAFKANGDPTWDGSAFVYDGTGDYHSLSGGDTSTFEVGSSNFTLEQWVYITSASSVCSTFFSKGNNNSVGTEFMSLQTTNNGTTPGFFFGSGSSLLAGSSVGTDGWHHYVVTRSGNNFTLYVDGTSVDTATSSSSLASGITGGVNIGAQSYSVSADGRKLNGKISITRLYGSRVLTAAEVTLNYNAGHTATTSAVVATVDLNANNPSSYPGTLSAVDTTDTTIAGGSQIGSLKVFNTFTPPSGDTNQRPSKPKPGQLYYNYDLKTIEFHDGYGWRQADYTTRSGRALIAGGNSAPGSPAYTSVIQSYNITTLGNTINFGDRTTTAGGVAGFSNGTRAVFGGGLTPTYISTIDYASTQSGGTAVSFGTFLNGTAHAYRGAASSSTRGIFLSGYTGSATNTNAIEYIQISTTGNGVEFGQTTTDSGKGRRSTSALSSPTRVILAGGYSDTYISEMDYITISTLGNSLSFGDLTLNAFGAEGVSNTIVGAFGGGRDATAFNTTIDYLQISTTGSTSQFGDLTVATTQSAGSSNNTRGVFAGGYNPGYNETMSYISFDSKGDSIDFGNLSLPVHKAAGTSDSHGGLGGF